MAAARHNGARWRCSPGKVPLEPPGPAAAPSPRAEGAFAYLREACHGNQPT
jgi:hypothetical protein